VSKSRRDEVIEEVEWLMDYDNPESIAKRLGYANGITLTRKLYLYGATELAAEFDRRVTTYNAFDTGTDSL
jgi:hypothetical protein